MALGNGVPHVEATPRQAGKALVTHKVVGGGDAVAAAGVFLVLCVSLRSLLLFARLLAYCWV